MIWLDGEGLERNRIGRLVTNKSRKEVWLDPSDWAQTEHICAPCEGAPKGNHCRGTLNNQVDKTMRSGGVRGPLYLATAMLRYGPVNKEAMAAGNNGILSKLANHTAECLICQHQRFL